MLAIKTALVIGLLAVVGLSITAGRDRPGWLRVPVVLAALVPLISARTTPYLFLALVLLLLARAYKYGDVHGALPKLNFVTGSFGCFIIYAACSAIWSVDPARTLTRVGFAALAVFGSFVAANLLRQQERADVVSMANGIWSGFLVGTVFFLLELATDQSVRIWLFNALHFSADMLTPGRYYTWATDELVSIDRFILVRSVTPLTLLFWPAIVAVIATIKTPWRPAMIMLLGILTTAVVMLAPSTTSKITVAFGVLAYLVARRANRFVLYSLAAAWIISCLCALPAGWLLERLDPHSMTWLGAGGQNRLVMWNYTIQQTLEAPILGRGADTHHRLAHASAEIQALGRFEVQNIFVQTWFELGAVGALLLMTAGLAVLWRIQRLTADEQPFAYAMVATSWLYLSFSYQLWQFWYIGLFELTAVLFMVARRAVEVAETGRSP